MINTFYDAYSVLSKVYSDGAYLSQAIADTPIEPDGKAKTIKISYGVLDKDIYLEYALSRLCERSPKLKIKILLKIAMYSVKFLGNKEYAVSDSIVELTKKLGKGGNAGFVNAVLRRFYTTEIPLPEDKFDRASVEYSMPLFAVKKLFDEYGEDTARAILSYDEEHSFARFSSREEGERYLTDKGYEFSPTVFPDLFSVKKLSLNEDFDRGTFTFQSIGSAAICDVCGRGKSLLDACAAPGGKACYLSQKFKRVVATEIHSHRADLIRAYARRMKVDNVEVITADSTVFRKEFESAFDLVLCDVPCSGYGTVKDNPDIKLRKNNANVCDIVKTQSAILENCSRYVRSGCAIVYSTCSFFDEENDKIIEKFLNNHHDYEIAEITSPLPFCKKRYGLQFLPHISCGAGYYVSKLIKKG